MTDLYRVLVPAQPGYRYYADDGTLIWSDTALVPVPGLSDDERAALERWAEAHPHELDRLWPLSEAQRGYLLALVARMPARDPYAYPLPVDDPQVQFLLDCAADVVAFLG